MKPMRADVVLRKIPQNNICVPSEMKLFRKTVLAHWKKEGRHDLPWRQTSDPYRIMVSEIMLQQTQVPRVIEKYKEFLQKFPTIETLAGSDLATVLRVWSGLGYNRRGKFLLEAAKVIRARHGGAVPRTRLELESLPGIGAYTAGAIRVFAFNESDVFIETNIRAVFIHHFFPQHDRVSDSELLPLVREAARRQDPRTWYWALMDYGAYLKSTNPNPSRRSAHHAKQSQFEGSLRQVRGAILRELHRGPTSVQRITSRLSFDHILIKQALAALAKDKMIEQMGRKWRIAK